MTLELAVISIIVITVLMILAMFIRSKSRDDTQYTAIDFNHNGDCWTMTIRIAQLWCILYTHVKIVPSDLLTFRPRLSYSIELKGQKVISVPNFWANYVGLFWGRAIKINSMTICAEIVSKDLAMAQSFEAKLLDIGYDVYTMHNKVVFTFRKP
ncbi:MAG: hypothetical protein FWE34_08385 [Defluviitaleaceae bacterium]|nr:hypothetical protein [Defluviitaleaceae bacterium]